MNFYFVRDNGCGAKTTTNLFRWHRWNSSWRIQCPAIWSSRMNGDGPGSWRRPRFPQTCSWSCVVRKLPSKVQRRTCQQLLKGRKPRHSPSTPLHPSTSNAGTLRRCRCRCLCTVNGGIFRTQCADVNVLLSGRPYGLHEENIAPQADCFSSEMA